MFTEILKLVHKNKMMKRRSLRAFLEAMKNILLSETKSTKYEEAVITYQLRQVSSQQLARNPYVIMLRKVYRESSLQVYLELHGKYSHRNTYNNDRDAYL